MTVAIPAGRRFDQKRTAIIAAATPVMKIHGVKGMRLSDVAESIGLGATGITYYFPRKEELAVACLEASFAIYHEFLDAALAETGTEARVMRFVSAFYAYHATTRSQNALPLLTFGDIRALDGETGERMRASYSEFFRRVRELFVPAERGNDDPVVRRLKTLILLEQIYWSNSWLERYDLEDYPRVLRRFSEIVRQGLAARFELPPAEPRPEEIIQRPTESAKESFLLAATRQINDHGYRGASVDRISASMNLTKGAFYHHNSAKDDLVAECFRRTFDIIRSVQLAAQKQPGSEADRLAWAVTQIVRFQQGESGPLLRTAAMTAIPPEFKNEILTIAARTNERFAAMISDAITEGTIRPVDPTIASSMLGAAINAAADFVFWKSTSLQLSPDAYARLLLCGLLEN